MSSTPPTPETQVGNRAARQRRTRVILAVLLPLALILGIRAYLQWRDFQESNRLFLLSDQLLSAGRTKQAIPLLEKSIELCPDMLVSWDALGICYEETGQAERAIELLRRGTELYSNSQTLFCQLGMVQMHAGRNLEAAASFARAFQLEPDNFLFDKLRARCEKAAAKAHP